MWYAISMKMANWFIQSNNEGVGVWGRGEGEGKGGRGICCVHERILMDSKSSPSWCMFKH
jgi:hypothetical protein